MKKTLLYIALAISICCAIFFGVKYYQLKNQDTIYISSTGSYYHSNPTCSNMIFTIKITQEEAERLVKKPCSICVKSDQGQKE